MLSMFIVFLYFEDLEIIPNKIVANLLQFLLFIVIKTEVFRYQSILFVLVKNIQHPWENTLKVVVQYCNVNVYGNVIGKPCM